MSFLARPGVMTYAKRRILIKTAEKNRYILDFSAVLL